MLTKSFTPTKERDLEKDASPSKPSQDPSSGPQGAARRLSQDDQGIDASVLPAGYTLRPAVEGDLMAVTALLRPLVEQRLLLRRTKAEMATLLQTGFVAEFEQELIGFSAVEIYSKKLCEIQCLAVAEPHRRHGIGGQLIRRCVDLAK